jgi:hypothetical protein
MDAQTRVYFGFELIDGGAAISKTPMMTISVEIYRATVM